MIKIGKIVNTHALKGELKIKSFSDFFEERFKKGNKLYIQFNNDMIEVIVKQSRQQKNLVYVLFEQLNHINFVEKYKNCDIFIKKADIHELAEDEYYFHELMGCKVYSPDFIGEVVEVLDYPAQQILVVGEKRIMIPFVNAFVKDVNIKEKTIQVVLIDGML